jgi:hypothetical protein
MPTVKNELLTLHERLGVRGRLGALTALGWISPPRDLKRRPKRPPSGPLMQWLAFVLATYVRAGSLDGAAAELSESPAQVKAELIELYRILGVHGSIDAVRRLGWLTITPPAKTARRARDNGSDGRRISDMDLLPAR